MQMKSKIVTTSALVSIMALTASACGGSGGTAATGSGGGGAGGKTVTIGLSSILSGPAATAGQGTDAGIKAYMDTVNAAGGVNGYKFAFNEQDNAYNPAQSATVARTLVSNNVFCIVTEGSNPLAATVPITNPHQIPIFAEANGETFDPPASPYQYSYGINPSYHALADQGAQFVLDGLHETKAATVDLNNAGEDIANGEFTKYFKAHGGTVVDSEVTQLTTTDYSPFAEKLKASGAPVVYTFVLDSELPGLQKAAAAIGYHPKWVTWFDPYTTGYLQLAGPLAAGVYVSYFLTPLNDTSDPQVAAYLTAMKKYEPAEINNQPASQGWTFGAIIADAVRKVTAGGKPLTKSAFLAALGLNGAPVGLVKSMTYTSSNHVGSTEGAYYQIQPDNSLKAVTPYQPFPTP